MVDKDDGIRFVHSLPWTANHLCNEGCIQKGECKKSALYYNRYCNRLGKERYNKVVNSNKNGGFSVVNLSAKYTEPGGL